MDIKTATAEELKARVKLLDQEIEANEEEIRMMRSEISAIEEELGARSLKILNEALRMPPVPIAIGEIHGDGAAYIRPVPEEEALRLFGGKMPDGSISTIHAIPDTTE